MKIPKLPILAKMCVAAFVTYYTFVFVTFMFLGLKWKMLPLGDVPIFYPVI